jgi:hypothetical protein
MAYCINIIKMIRKAVASGSFYPENKEELENEIRKYLGNKKNVSGVISPHAGYVYCGKIMGKVLGMLGEKKNFIILGVNHSGIGHKVSFSLQDFETPLGIIRNNNAFCEKIIQELKHNKINAEISEESHKKEHSIEVLLPFLQLNKDCKIIPILVKNLSYEECLVIGRVIEKHISDNTGVIVSSDFTHYGSIYGFVPFTERVEERLRLMDTNIIKSIVGLKPESVFKESEKTTACGSYGMTIITQIGKIRKWRASLEDYSTSGEVTHDWENVVGYAGIVFS